MFDRRRELHALSVLLLIVVGLPTAVFGYRYVYRPRTEHGVKVFDLKAQMPEGGGWQPERITVNQGDRVRLRIHGVDVVHGFAIGRLDPSTSSGQALSLSKGSGQRVEPVVVQPGEVKIVEFVADRAGRFTFYCHTWCSPYHYRMRGDLEVLGPDGTLPVEPPTATEQHLNRIADQVDQPHPATFYPTPRPSAAAGKLIAERYSDTLAPWRDADELRGHSPSDVFSALRPVTADLTPEARWDLVAYLWYTSTTPERLATGRRLYEKNCAACHAVTGTGDGPGWQYLDDQPQSFADPTTMAGGTSWIYYAKTARGGMGTGMPYFGTLFTEEEMWGVVDYLWTFLFDYGEASQD
ncbi:MAG: c-type cytochrome [Anaerolineae bacterium]